MRRGLDITEESEEVERRRAYAEGMNGRNGRLGYGGN